LRRAAQKPVAAGLKDFLIFVPMPELRKIKRKDLDLDKYTKAINDALNYRIYAEYWYLDILTGEKWECWIYGDYEVVMPIPLQYKFGIKFVLQPVYCQQLGVFYSEEIPDELFKEFEKKLHKYRVRAYHFNEENTERYQPEGEKRVNYILDLNRPYEEIYNNYKKDRKRNIRNSAPQEFILKKEQNLDNYFELLKQNYPGLYQKFIYKNEKRLKQLLNKCNIIPYIIEIGGEISNYRIFLVSKNRIFLIGSARNKKIKVDFSSYMIDIVIQEFSHTKHYLDFEGSTIKGVATFNESFGAEKKFYTEFTNFIV